MRVSFIKKVAEERELIITGTSELGVECYYRLLPKQEMLKELMDLPKGSVVNLSQYGEIIERGYGDPPEA